MTVPIKQLQDKNNQDFYPETVKAAVADYDAITADDVAETEPVEPVVTTAMIVDNAVTNAKLADNTITKNKIDLSTFSGNYSTNEQDTGFTWINGKKIYKKTLDFGYITAATTRVAHGISNFDTLIKYEGMSKGNDGIFRNMQYVGQSLNALFTVDVDSTRVTIITGVESSRYNFYYCYFTLYYTKNEEEE